MTRRALLLFSGSALSWSALRPTTAFLRIGEESDLEAMERPLLKMPVQVPRDFVGMHAHRWPAESLQQSPAPAYPFGAVRSHDHDGLLWSDLHVGRDRYTWACMDRWVGTHSTAGRTLIYTLYGTPAWLASETSRRDLYGRIGGAAPPTELNDLAAFIQAMLARYNGDGQRRIAFIETWNEPHFRGEDRDFWWGSAEQLVAIGRAIYVAANARTYGVRVLSPGFVADPRRANGFLTDSTQRHRSMVEYLNASDRQGRTGASWCDGIAFHTYNVALHGRNLAGLNEIREIRHSLQRLSLSLPIYNTECGFVSPHPFRDLPSAKQATFLKRLGALQAAHGVQALYFYSHDDELIGNPSLRTEIAAAIGALNQQLAGAVLRQVNLRSDGSVQVTTDAGSFVW